MLSEKLDYTAREAQEARLCKKYHGYLHDNVYWVIYKAAAGLAEIGPDAKETLPRLKKKLSDEDCRVRGTAVDAIQKIDPEEGRKIKIDDDGKVTMEPSAEPPAVAPAVGGKP